MTPVARRLTLLWSGLVVLMSVARPAVSAQVEEEWKQVVPKLIVHKGEGVQDIGAGIIVDVRGKTVFIATAYHVVEDAERIDVTFYGKRHAATPGVLYEKFKERDDLDVAVVIVELDEEARKELPELPREVAVATASALREGEQARPVGHPLDSEWQVSYNIAIEGLSHGGDGRKLRFTRGTIERGSSGGPLFDERGALAGMVTTMETVHGIAVKVDALVAVLQEWGIPRGLLVPLGSLVVDSEPRGAEVFLAGTSRGSTTSGPVAFHHLKPSSYALRVLKDGYLPWEKTVEVLPGGEHRELAQLRVTMKQDFLVMIVGSPDALDPGVKTAETTLAGELTRRGFKVVHPEHVDELRSGDERAMQDADAEVLATLGRQYAEVVVVGRLQSEAEPATGRFFTGRAVLDLRTYLASNARYLGAETIEVGATPEVPGKLGPTARLARIAAAKEAAERGVAAVMEYAEPQLRGQGQLVIVALGAKLQEAEEMEDLLRSSAGVSHIHRRFFAGGERLELDLEYAGNPDDLGDDLDGRPVGGRRLRLVQAEDGRLTLRIEP